MALPIHIYITDKNTATPILSTVSPRKCVIKTTGGAAKHRCWLELYNEDTGFSVQLGNWLTVVINNVLSFKGRIIQKRIDSIDDMLSLVAEWDAEKEWNQIVTLQFENKTIPEMIQSLLAGTKLHVGSIPAHSVRFHKMDFAGAELMQVLDFLAKIAGNWQWRISRDGFLSFKTGNQPASHTVFLKEDSYTIDIWETTDDLYTSLEIHGGIVDGNTYQKWLSFPELNSVIPPNPLKVYFRFVTSLDVFSALERAITQQMHRPHYEHFIDLTGQGEQLQDGDTIQFRISRFPLFPQNQIFRIKAREITFAHNQLQTRLHLTSGLESSSDYFYYFKKDAANFRSYLTGRTGAFQLDVSSLDSNSHLDAA